MTEKQDLVEGFAVFFDTALEATARLRAVSKVGAAERARVAAAIARSDDELVPAEVLAQGEYSMVTIVEDERSSQATVLRAKDRSPLLDLLSRGVIDEEQYGAACEIAAIVERMEGTVGMRSASLEARVDNSGAAKDLLIETLGQVRREVAYGKWRDHLPYPKRMVIDMVVLQRPIFATARRYRMGLPKARTRLVDALTDWLKVKEEVFAMVDERDVLSAHWRVGGGILK